MRTPVTSGGVYAALSELWPKNGYAILPEVGNATGSNARRHADAVVMSLWPSRGLDIYGVEIKVSRSDWQSELKKPEKAHEIAQYCDGWYLAVSTASIVKDGELPSAWGLIVCDGGKAKIVKAAPKLEAKALTRGFVAAMLRRAADFTRPEEWVKEAVDKESRRQSDSWKKHYEADAERHKEHARQLQETINNFETATGVRIGGWDQNKAVANMRAVREFLSTTENVTDQIRRAKAWASQIAIAADTLEKSMDRPLAANKQGGSREQAE
jgi:hypothetical protein